MVRSDLVVPGSTHRRGGEHRGTGVEGTKGRWTTSGMGPGNRGAQGSGHGSRPASLRLLPAPGWCVVRVAEWARYTEGVREFGRTKVESPGVRDGTGVRSLTHSRSTERGGWGALSVV